MRLCSCKQQFVIFRQIVAFLFEGHHGSSFANPVIEFMCFSVTLIYAFAAVLGSSLVAHRPRCFATA